MALVLAATLALGACGTDASRSDAPRSDGSRSDGSPSGPGPTASPASPAPSAPGPTTAPPPETEPAVAERFRFSAPLLGGGRLDGRAFATTGVALWFWAPG